MMSLLILSAFPRINVKLFYINLNKNGSFIWYKLLQQNFIEMITEKLLFFDKLSNYRNSIKTIPLL